MTQIIVYTNENGGVSVCYPTGELPIEEVQSKDIPQGIQSYIVNSESLPEQDNDFFDAWEQSLGIVTVNIEKARQITKIRLRREREPLFAKQDLAFQLALETGTDTTAIVAEKQRLRDITKLADIAQTLDELRNIQVEAA